MGPTRSPCKRKGLDAKGGSAENILFHRSFHDPTWHFPNYRARVLATTIRLEEGE